jgi:hypothetical protein
MTKLEQIEEARAKIAAIRGDPKHAYWKGQPEAVAMMSQLYEIVAGKGRAPKRKLWGVARCRSWLLRFGNPRRAYPNDRAAREIPEFTDAAGGRALRSGHVDAGEIDGIRQVVVAGLEEIATGREFMLQASDLMPTTTICAVPGAGYYSGGARDVFLLAVRDFIASSHCRAIAKCRHQGCTALIVRRRRQLYCSSKCSRAADAERSRRRRAAVSPEERFERRRERYQRSVGLKRKIGYRGARPRKPAETAPASTTPAMPRTIVLSPRALELLSRLAAFTNGASFAELARGLGAPKKSVVQWLAELAHKSLVVQATDGRWLALGAPASTAKQE